MIHPGIWKSECKVQAGQKHVLMSTDCLDIFYCTWSYVSVNIDHIYSPCRWYDIIQNNSSFNSYPCIFISKCPSSLTTYDYYHAHKMCLLDLATMRHGHIDVQHNIRWYPSATHMFNHTLVGDVPYSPSILQLFQCARFWWTTDEIAMCPLRLMLIQSLCPLDVDYM